MKKNRTQRRMRAAIPRQYRAIPNITMDHPAVQDSKARWDWFNQGWIKNRKNTVSFEDWFDMCKSECISLSMMAEHAGLTRERARQIYNKYFRHLFGNRSGAERWKSCSIVKHEVSVIERQHALLKKDKLLAQFVQRAEAAGNKIEFERTYLDGLAMGVKARRMRINGVLCSLHIGVKGVVTSRYGKALYSHFGVQRGVLEKTQAFVMYVKPPGLKSKIYVVPNDFLLDLWGRHPWRAKSIYIPLTTPTIKRGLRKSDLSGFIDAWDVLAELDTN